MKKLSCIYCNENTFNRGEGSEEHAILSSIGGKKSSRNICCRECNRALGNEIDEPLAKSFSFLSTYCGIKQGRGKDSAKIQQRFSKDSECRYT